MKDQNQMLYPIILAGGRGTRFWPLSRKKRAKQMLALDGPRTMIQQTVERLLPLAPAKRFWIITNEDLRSGIAKQLPKLPKQQILAEPIGRNTAPAIGLAAFLLLQHDPDAILGMFPSDHVVQDESNFKNLLKQAAHLAAEPGVIVVLGIHPSRPETGYGYIETGKQRQPGVLQVRRFTEKPDLDHAAQFVAAGNYFWNAGMFIWSARTLVDALREHLPRTAAHLEALAATFGTNKFEATFRKLYPKCENISVDYAVMEPRTAKGENASRVLCLPADFGWNDLGSWTALHEHRTRKDPDRTANVIHGQGSFTHQAEGNYVHAPKKFVALVDVKDLVVVETDDAILVTTREHSQNVGKVVKYLDEKKLSKLV